MRPRWLAVSIGSTLLLLGIVFSYLDPYPESLSSILRYSGLAALCTGVIFLFWRWATQGQASRKLIWALITTIAVRLVGGVVLHLGLPTFGYKNVHQEAGYLFPDAFMRDRSAMEIVNSGSPLLDSFIDPEVDDQYGGMVFLQAWLYRYLSGGMHRPLLFLFATVTAYTLAVLATWKLIGELFGREIGSMALWLLVLYPEAILLSTSQMREPFLILGIAWTLAGYMAFRNSQSRRDLLSIIGGVSVLLFFSPPTFIVALIALGILWVLDQRFARQAKVIVLITLAIVGLGAILLLTRAWARTDPGALGSVANIVRYWVFTGAQYEIYQLEQTSGVVQYVFDVFPEWLHLPAATLYGLAQPFLPAALADNSGSLFARILAVTRAGGWYFLLPFLLYAPLASLRNRGWRDATFLISLIVWGMAIFASFRTAGDQWDNVRYRTIFFPAQVMLLNWALAHVRVSRSPWLRRIVILLSLGVISLLHWYLGRYYQTPHLDLFGTLLLTVGLIALYLVVLAFKSIQDRREQRRT